MVWMALQAFATRVCQGICEEKTLHVLCHSIQTITRALDKDK